MDSPAVPIARPGRDVDFELTAAGDRPMNMKPLSATALAVMVWGAASAYAEEVYKIIDERGNITYQNWRPEPDSVTGLKVERQEIDTEEYIFKLDEDRDASPPSGAAADGEASARDTDSTGTSQ